MAVGDIVSSVLSFRENSLICDGSLIPSGSDFNLLRSLVGSRVPDLRGSFLSGNFSGRNLLSFNSHGLKTYNNSDFVLKDFSINYFIIYKEDVFMTATQSSQLQVIFDFVSNLVSNFFSSDCSKAIKYQDRLNNIQYATDEIKYVSNYIREENEY